jgi:hypothetical protein
MAVPRNYRVLRGQRGTEARTKYLAYLQGLALPDKTNTVVKPRAAKKVLYITPFTVSLGADTFLEATALSDAYTKLGLQQVKDRSAEALTDTQKSLKLRGSKAARVSAT